MKPCLLPDSDRARFANLAGTVGVLVQAEMGRGGVSPAFAETIQTTLLLMADIVGVPDAELHEASAAFLQSSDREKWLKHMVAN